MSENRTKILFWIFFIIITALYVGVTNPHFRFMEGASAIKILWTRAILSAEGYTDIGRIGSPPEIVRPPGFAIMLSFVSAFAGEKLYFWKFANNLFAPAGFIALFFLLKRRCKNNYRAAGIAFIGYLFPGLFILASFLESELMFMFFFYLAILFFENAYDNDFKKKKTILLFSFMMALACITRTAGFIIVPSALPAIFFKDGLTLKRRILVSLFIVLAWAVVGGGWMVRNQIVSAPGENTYIDKILIGEPVESIYWLAEDHRVPLLAKPKQASVTDIFLRLPTNSIYLTRQCADSIWTGVSNNKISYLVVLPLLISFSGLVLGLLKKRRLIDFSLILYLLMVLFYSYQDSRFLLPVVPFIVLFFIEAILYFSDKKPARIFTYVALALLIATFLSQDIKRLISEKAQPQYPITDIQSEFPAHVKSEGAYHTIQLLSWIKQESKATDRVLYHSFSPCAVVAERQCSAIPMVSPQRLMRFIEEEEITLVVVDDEASHGSGFMSVFTPQFLFPVLKTYPERFDTVYQLPGTEAAVMRVIER